jgi:hypothetical protein
MILPSLDSSRYDESDRKKIIEIQSLDAEKINFEVFYYLYLINFGHFDFWEGPGRNYFDHFDHFDHFGHFNFSFMYS